MTQALSHWQLPVWQCDPAPAARAPLEGDVQADVCVVGAGLTGLWTAYHLARRQPGLRVQVVEAGYVGFGASGRNGGWCSALFPWSRAALLRRHGRAPALAMLQACREAVDEVGRIAAQEQLDVHFRKGGSVVVARSAAAMRHAHRDVSDTRLDPAAQLDLLDRHGVADHVRVAGAVGGTWTPDCAALHPLRLVTGLAGAAERRGVRIAEGTRALRIDPGRVRTDRGTVRCSHVVLATEAYTPLLGGRHHRRVAPVYSLMVATPPLPDRVWDEIGLADGQTFSEHRHLVVYGQRTADGRLAFGGRGAPYHWHSTVRPAFDQNEGVHRSLATLLGEYFPVLRRTPGGARRIAGIGLDHAWGGPLGVARDWHPSVGLDPSTLIGWAGGYVGDGVALSQLAGATLADLVTGTETARTRLPWVGHRSPAWEPEPLRWLGVNAGLALATAADRHPRLARPAAALLGRATGG